MVFRGPFADVSIPDISLTELVFSRLAQHPDKPALIDGLTGRTITYAELHERIRRVAASLAKRGFNKGDVLAIYSPNVPEYAVAFHAVAMLGGVNTTINPLSTTAEVGKQLDDCRAKYLLTVPQLVDEAREAARGTQVRELFIFGDSADAVEGTTAFDSLLEADAADVPHVVINPREDLAALPYSSGTTGVCKGVMLTHYNMVANLRQVEGTGHSSTDDTLVCVLPLFHIYGMQVIMNCGLYMGATIVTLPRFELPVLLSVFERYGVTMAHLVPPVVLALAKHPSVDDYDLSKLKTVFSAAAPLGEQVARACAERLGCTVKQGYGMTEASPATHMTPPVNVWRKYGSVGLCVPNMECKIVDVETGRELGADEEGEILVRGPQVMRGYLNRPDATAETIDADGWLHTGDIGYADRDGCFYIVDRAKELIKYKGFQVAPAELEAVLLEHPSVADAAVIPSPDDDAGEIPKAFIVARGGEASAEELMKFVAARVAPYKKVRKVEFIEQIPKSPSGKILRRLLVARERAGRN
ncbi:MAG TPA: 4-coumarate--CoA ligase family protein [Pyrinomonadaceae bacterium]|nr:4-coumarate--CoA ligase family protein [Pyrinomonadaceae bacterium]